MNRDALSAGLVLLLMTVQVTFVNRLPLPGDAAPDLVLLAVVGYALARGARAGAVMGFTAGLFGDLLPPAAHEMGQYALVLCLVGFVAGRWAESRPEAGLAVALGCAALGPVVAVVVGVVFGGAEAGVVALTGGLLPVMLYNVLAAPPMVWAATRVVRGRDRSRVRSRERGARRAGRLAGGRP
ncbi:rod shape-determining protein MreD [Planomonospora sphaerica]|uniref:Rod shape-determining protein MreD n=1 Tax=Planomonospora sphaerica TaxID=161355 RepID=A0A171DGZ1_9ACTN|nr:MULTISPECIES: rod shape-determining protein MreD [Planomonospora]GAT68424.1 rod shape-determining protein MreD [Planomonospora sphaerica]